MFLLALMLGFVTPQEPLTQETEVHPHDHAPIDCPLRKAGIDPSGLRPFAEVEAYIAFLERSDREKWQKPDLVVAHLGLKGDERVADLGAGSGYFTFRLAKALPEGSVMALDIEPEMVRHIHHRSKSESIDNIEARIIAPDDPGIDASVDLVFVCDVLHHVQQRHAWLRRLHDEMKAGARLALIEFREGDLPEGPPEQLKITRAELLKEMDAAGFALIQDQSELLPYQTFLVFQKAG